MSIATVKRTSRAAAFTGTYMFEKKLLEPPKRKKFDDSKFKFGGADPGRWSCSSSSYTVELMDDTESTVCNSGGSSLLCGADADLFALDEPLDDDDDDDDDADGGALPLASFSATVMWRCEANSMIPATVFNVSSPILIFLYFPTRPFTHTKGWWLFFLHRSSN